MKYSYALDWVQGLVSGVVCDAATWSKVWDKRQKAAKEGTPDRFFRFMDWEAEMLPGAGYGRGSHAMSYSFNVGDFLHVQLASVSGLDDKERSVAFVQLKGKGCAGMQTRRCLDHFQEICGQFGIQDPVIKPNRVDFRCDISGLNVSYFEQLTNRRSFVTLAKKYQPHFAISSNFTMETMYYGSKDGDIKFRLYDKLRELQVGGRAKLEHYKATNPGWVEQETTRVEIEMNREYLSSRMHVDTLDDLRRSLQVMVGHCCLKWLRFVDDSTVTRHTNAMLDPVWGRMYEQWQEVLAGDEPDSEPLKFKFVDKDARFAQAAGCLVSVAAGTLDELDKLQAQFNSYVDEHREKLNDKLRDARETRLRTLGEFADAAQKAHVRTLAEIGDTCDESTFRFLREQHAATERARKAWPEAPVEMNSTEAQSQKGGEVPENVNWKAWNTDL